MACNSIQRHSSFSPRMMWKYDVFVSFRGEDTRNNFTDHLFGALHRNGVVAFKDDTKLKKGEHISSELLQAIEGSRILIVVFSRDYASSTWCLRELAKIADCIEVSGQTVLPIFYDVNPSEVRKQSGDYGKAFVEHEERFKENLEEVQRWRGALAQVANLSGWDVRDKPQYAEIGKIIKEVTCLLDHKFPTLPGELVGMHSRGEEIEKLLLLDSDDDDVHVVGICGMGGIGKTTLATVLYDRISNQFDASCFIDDVSKIYGDYGPIGVQKQLLCQTLMDENLHICNLPTASKLIRTRLCQMKALVVLDNVDQVEQLDKLAMKREWLGAGRIIIISRDEHILREHGVDEVYKVQLLDYDNAVQLFCRKAFKCDDITRDYVDLTDDVLSYANGLPLAIKVLGSFLYGRDVAEWRSALARLRENPRKDIMDVLRISFDQLEDTEKGIFLDIACFSYEESSWYVNKLLEIRGFHSKIGIRVLIDKSLITREKGRIIMHDLLKELGKSIVREKFPKEPRKWSRLWDYKDVHNAISENMETGNLEALVLQQYPNNIEEIREMKTLRAEGLAQMSRLKLLILRNLNFSGSLNFLSSELRYLYWDKYPFTCLPSNFEPDKLVELTLRYSNIKQLWEGTKPLHSLTRIALSHSKNLIKLPNFREIPNLEELDLEGCVKLVQIDPSIGRRRLASLNLKNCKNLVSVPNSIFGLSSLKSLNLSGCPKLLKKQWLGKQRQIEHLEKLDNKESNAQCQSTSSICKVLMPPFRFLRFRKHEESVGSSSPSLLSRLSCLHHLDLSFCNLRQIPNAIGLLHCLEELNLGGNNFVTLPSSIKELSKLRVLNLEHCKHLKYLPELPSSTVLPTYRAGLYIFDCPNLRDMECCYRMVFSWMIQLIEVHVQSYHPRPWCEIKIVVPGTQIPLWFDKQNVGGSISMDPLPILDDNNWIGVACCLTFVAHDDPTVLSEGRRHHDDPNDSGERWPHHINLWFTKEGLGYLLTIPIHPEKDLVTVELDHLLLFFFIREQFIVPNGMELETIVKQPQGLHLEVKNCGYRWVFKEDLEQLNPKMMSSGNLPAQNKFLTND